MHIAIVGAGSVGGFVGAQMARAGYHVSLVDQWPQHVEAMQADGLRIEGTSGDFTVPVRALHIHQVQSLINDPVDVALICVKSYDSVWAAALIEDYLTPQGVVVSVQNSFNEERIAEIVGWRRVLGCIVNTIGVEVTAPGRILRWYKPSSPDYAVFRVGEMSGMATERAARIAKALSTADVSKVTTNLWGERWSKLVINSMGSGIGALTGIGLVQMYRDDRIRPLAYKLGREAIEVGTAMGFALESICGVTPEQWLLSGSDEKAHGEVDAALRAWADRIGEQGQASTLHDFKRGRRMEAEGINGLVAAKAEQVGVNAPHHAEIVRLTRLLERGEIAQEMAAISHLLN